MARIKRNTVWIVGAALLLLMGCESSSYVLVNVTLGNLTVDQVVIRGYPDGRIVEQKTSVLPDSAGEAFTQSVNLVLVVPDSWVDRLVWITAEGVHQGEIVGHGRTSVVPREGKLVDATITLSPGLPPCGNGIIDGGEQCDGTELGGHTCLSYTGMVHGQLLCEECQIIDTACHDCGNGQVETGPEQCDGTDFAGQRCATLGFVQGTLGCSDTCQFDLSDCEQGCGNNVVEDAEECDGTDHAFKTCADYGYLRGHLVCTDECMLESSGCEGFCGDGQLDPGESCDGSQFGEQTCATATGHVGGALGCTGDCHLDVSGCMQPGGVCGDGLLDPGESCDGSAFGGQTCLTAAGRAEGALSCTTGCFLDISACHTCGDGVLEAAEECDGAVLGGQSCLTVTGLPDGQLGCDGSCAFNVVDCTECGDGSVLADEACDDGNAQPGDGCDGACQVEPGWSCAGTPSSCAPGGCGDGVLSGPEGCDDGNVLPGDGCDAACQAELGFVCHGEPSTCVADASAIFVDCAAACGGGGGRTDPLCSVQDAVDAASPGQVVVLLAQTPCVETVVVQGTDLHLVGEAGATLDGPSCPALYIANATVTVWELTFLQGVEVDNFGSAVVQRCDIGPSPCVGVRCRNDSHCVVQKNSIHDNDDGGLWMSASSFSVSNNLVYRNGLWGTSSRGGMWTNSNGYSPTDVVNNTFVYNEAQDSSFDGGVRCITSNPLRNNIVWGNTGPQLSASCDPWYNIIMDPLYAGWQGNLYVNPVFVNPTLNDYRLSPLSPAVDVGDPAGVPPAPPTDMDGVSRPLGNGVDLGAYEAQ